MQKTVYVNTIELQTMINILHGVINSSIERSGFQAMFDSFFVTSKRIISKNYYVTLSIEKNYIEIILTKMSSYKYNNGEHYRFPIPGWILKITVKYESLKDNNFEVYIDHSRPDETSPEILSYLFGIYFYNNFIKE